MSGKVDIRVARQIDRLIREVETLSDELHELNNEDEIEPTLSIEMRDLLYEIAGDDDLPVFRRNQARDLVRRVDKELRSDTWVGAELAS